MPNSNVISKLIASIDLMRRIFSVILLKWYSKRFKGRGEFEILRFKFFKPYIFNNNPNDYLPSADASGAIHIRAQKVQKSFLSVEV